MADEKKVVNLAVEPTPQIDRSVPVVEEAPQPEPVVETTESTEEVQTPVVQPTNADVDEFGVPWKNRAMEYKRKHDEFVEKIPQIIDEKLTKANQSQTPQYTYEQLEVYKAEQQANIGNDPNASRNIAWATTEQRKMQQAENKKFLEEIVTGRENQNRIEQQKQASLNYVQQNYPEAFTTDAQGRPVSWNEASPMTQTIRAIMQRPDFANHPEGLSAAADIAYGRLARSQTPILQQKIQQAKGDIKQAQKASLTEGSGRRTLVTTTPVQSSIDVVRKTGSIKDAENAIGAILRQRGILGDS